MNKPSSSVRVAAVQATPVFLDRDATIDKACDLIAEAGRNGAELAVFPEGFVPTVAERLVHGRGDGSTLNVYDLDVGRLAGLICWENYMPLARWARWARWALYTRGVQILAAPTWDRGEPWNATLRHIAKEGRAFVISYCSPVRPDDVPAHWRFVNDHVPASAWINPGGSAIVDPDGRYLVEPVIETEEILYADLDIAMLRGSRYQLDVAGHYGRPDVFDFAVRDASHTTTRGVPALVDGRSRREVDPMASDPLVVDAPVG